MIIKAVLVVKNCNTVFLSKVQSAKPQTDDSRLEDYDFKIIRKAGRTQELIS